MFPTPLNPKIPQGLIWDKTISPKIGGKVFLGLLDGNWEIFAHLGVFSVPTILGSSWR